VRVLVGYDGSALGDEALALVAGLAWPATSECRIVVVGEVAFATYAPGMEMDAGTLQTIYDARQEDAERLATAASRRVDRPGLAATWEVGSGRPANTILDAADRFHPDLLVVGNRGLGPLTSALLGSVSEELVDHAPCPVLVARGTDLRRVVLAEDGSPDAQAASTLLLRWPVFRASEIRVVSVSEVPVQPELATDPAASAGQRVAQEVVATTVELARNTAERLSRAGLHADTSIRQGDPAAEILAAASDWSADLIIIGTRGQTGLTRLLHGSVARKVLEHAHCSVLVERRR
jgi:nucleotide-binding universal stress UspA family protein